VVLDKRGFRLYCVEVNWGLYLLTVPSDGFLVGTVSVGAAKVCVRKESVRAIRARSIASHEGFRNVRSHGCRKRQKRCFEQNDLDCGDRSGALKETRTIGPVATEGQSQRGRHGLR